jgi:major intracellular serine protease
MTQNVEGNFRVIPYRAEDISVQQKGVPQGIRMIGAASLWDEGITGEGIVVAVLDTGCELHNDLKDNIIGGRNFTPDHGGDPSNFDDLNGHGTHVAGTIAANGEISGIAPKANLLICKVLDGSGSGSYEGIVRGLEYAIDWRGPNGEKVRVINMSLGGPHDEPNLHLAIKRAVENDIVVVCASGNEGDNDEDTWELAYPGASNEVVEVGAIDEIHRLAGFSNVNLEIDCVAPGVLIESTFPGQTYATLSGTSMAAPHVAGALALLAQENDKSFRRFVTEPELYAQLVKNTISLGYMKSTEGNGLVRLNVMDKIKSLIQYIQQNF